MGLKPGQFKINGLDSEEFNVYLRSRPQRLSAGRVIELKPRPGNDSVVVDFAYYKNVEWKIQCNAKADSLESVSNLEDRIRSWLDMSNYSDFTYIFDAHYIYQAVVVSPPVFTGTHKDADWVPFEFTISLRPFKQSRTGLRWLSNEKKIHNIEKYPSKPKIQVLGSGDISFWINDKKYELTNIGNEIIIDSLLEESYRIVDGILESQDNKTKFIDFPILPEGLTTIRWQGNVTEFRLMPRWWTKV
ncbi:phage tail protein [Enterococcus casseliflavus]|uniref:phage tail protein n=1 Tax=Enterococcus casseliflavus TaxID=37734 RepID=UPI0018836BE2|nr:phage tail protein [Enterococcus casseliflavus]MBE9898652.1 phage tail protein [Enterococcus casseliflavus]MBE9901938.1 phage tail protein [Enterococcus casseliflavus]MBE9922345.1 phage tail protein [Enterococcus casseliflavus]